MALVALGVMLLAPVSAELPGLAQSDFAPYGGELLYLNNGEIWRLDLFQQGTFIVWFVIGAGVPAAVLLVKRTIDILRRAPGAITSLSARDVQL